jgi:hypothetical protein
MLVVIQITDTDRRFNMPSGHPWVPPYFVSWDDLIRALLHDPFLGSPGGSGAKYPVPNPWHQVAEPQPNPWRHVVEGFVAAVGVRDLASQVSDDGIRKEMEQSADRSIAQLLDDYCGTPPRIAPWPWPGPLPGCSVSPRN